MFNSSLTFTSFYSSFFFSYRLSMIWLNASGNRYDAILNRQYYSMCFSSVILAGITADRQRNPVININILSSHKYFSGCYHRVFIFQRIRDFLCWNCLDGRFLCVVCFQHLGAGDQTFKRQREKRRKKRTRLGTADDGGSKPAGWG